MKRPRLTIKQILAWADAHHKRTRRWPTTRSGPVRGAAGENWDAINTALAQGFRGFPGGSSLTKQLAKHRGVRQPQGVPRLTIKQILLWADEYHRRKGKWPILRDGPVRGAPGVNWRKIDNALRLGLCGLSGGSSLPRLLADRRGVRNKKGSPMLTVGKILTWVDAHHQRTGEWPNAQSGPVPGSHGETWSGINGALHQGTRGLPGGSSLARFLDERRGVRNRKDLPLMTIGRILAWADAHAKRTGDWPLQRSGPIPGTRGETWRIVDKALRRGGRGLQGGSSLRQLLDRKRRYRN